MNIPDTIKIGGHILKVIITNDGDLLESNEIGKTQLAKNVIYLNSNYPQSRQEEALLHEMVHNCFYDLDNTMTQDEKLVERIGVALYMILQDNPDVFK